jgi:DNA-binding response OmpR family regulator
MALTGSSSAHADLRILKGVHRVLIVEDEPDLAEALDDGLRRHGFETERFDTRAAALDQAASSDYVLLVLRGTERRARNVVWAGDLEVDVDRYEARRQGEILDLTTKELALLVALARRPGDLVRRDELAEEVWGTGLWPVNRSLDVHMSSLRRKLGDKPRQPRYVQTVHGLGFRLLP